MLTQVRNSLRETSTTRALASLISDVSVEIAARRDTSHDRESAAALKVLNLIHDALQYAWHASDSYCAPENYSFAWDRYFESLPKLFRLGLRYKVARERMKLVSNLDTTLAIVVTTSRIVQESSVNRVLADLSV